MHSCPYLFWYIPLTPTRFFITTIIHPDILIWETPELEHYTSVGTRYTQILLTTMDSNAESSSAQARIAEDAATEKSPHTGAADGPSPVNQASATHPPNETRPSNNPKLDQMLQLFQKQLDLQQKQLDLLRQVAGTIDEVEPANSKAMGKQVDTFTEPDNGDWDPELVMKWHELRGPESPNLQRFGEDFLRYCEDNSLLRFSSNNKNILLMFGSDERSEVGTTIPVQKLTLAQRLRRH